MRTRRTYWTGFAVIALAAVLIASYFSFREARERAFPTDPASETLSGILQSVRDKSYPQLNDAMIMVRPLKSDSMYLEAQFTPASYFSPGRLHYVLLFNKEALARQVPAAGLRAIVAHELAHIDFYDRESRMGLFGLLRLLYPSFNANFERRADLEAIALGYGPGLEAYRAWVYRNIPADSVAAKKRDYFSPEEIEAILQAEKQSPGTLKAFKRCVPMNLGAIQQENFPATCPSR